MLIWISPSDLASRGSCSSLYYDSKESNNHCHCVRWTKKVYQRCNSLWAVYLYVCKQNLLSTKAGSASYYKFRISSTYCSSILQIGNSRYFQVNTLDTAKFMFRYHNNLLPPLFRNLFMTNSQVHRYDTRTASNYRVHSCRTNIKKFTILYQGPRIWNCLPASATNLSSFSVFKNKVLEFLLK